MRWVRWVCRSDWGGVEAGDQAEAAAVGHGADAVGGEVPDDLADLILVPVERQFLGFHGHLDLVVVPDVGAVAQQDRGLAQRAREVGLGGGGSLRPRVGEKGADRVVQAL